MASGLFIQPDWPAPKHIRALCTTRSGGVSQPPYDTLNLARHVGDDAAAVAKNRQLLQQQAGLPASAFWLQQQHTTDLLCLDNLDINSWQPVVADASWSSQANQVAVVMTADCMPILVTDTCGSFVCAIHAGWRGLADGIVSRSLSQLPAKPEELLVWIGPCIRQAHFEVGEDVYHAFIDKNRTNSTCFEPLASSTQQKYLADLPGLLNLELQNIGVTQIYDSQLCSFADTERFYSYRREGETGRMGSIIWIADSESEKPVSA